MRLLSIGAFAHATRLSPKALRLYDELGLLPPAFVDPASGYRFYDPAQLERARLVAWLRRLGMPLARIRVVCDSEPARAAEEVAAYWAQVEADTASRRDLAAFLIATLSGRKTTMPGAQEALAIRYAARTDIGRVRETNQDSAYAGSRLLAVADGMGSGGARASAAVIDALKPLDDALPAGDLLNALEQAVEQASDAVGGLEGAGEDRGQTGSTVTAMLWSGSQLALVHIGDCRAYLLRDGELFQITHDHTVVQSLLDEGRITPERRRRTRNGRCCCVPSTAPPWNWTPRCTTPGPVTGTCCAPTASPAWSAPRHPRHAARDRRSRTGRRAADRGGQRGRRPGQRLLRRRRHRPPGRPAARR